MKSIEKGNMTNVGRKGQKVVSKHVQKEKAETNIASLIKNEQYDMAFDLFWKEVSGNMERNLDMRRERTPVDDKFQEVQRRIDANQEILRTARAKMKDVNFASERRLLMSLSDSETAITSPKSAGDLEELKAEIEELKNRKPRSDIQPETTPGVAKFHNTVQDALDKLKKLGALGDFDKFS